MKTNHHKKKFCYKKLVIILLAISFLFFSCSKKEGFDEVSLRLKWIHQGQFAGFYIAKEKGFFEENNIDVTIRVGGQDLNAIKLVAAGSDTFGVCGGDQIIIAKEKKMPLKAIAVIYPKSPVCFTSLKKSNIKEPKDLIGKRVGMQYGTNVETEYIAMLKKLKIDRALIKEIPVQFNFQQLLEGQVDVWPSYIINEPILARERGYKVNVISPSDYGVKMYADTLFTNEKMIEKNPDLVLRFLKAVIKGWNYAINKPEEAAAAVLKFDEKLDKSHELKMIKAAIPLVKPSADYKIGWMERKIWEEMEKEILAQDLIEKEIDVNDIFTMEFLNKIY